MISNNEEACTMQLFENLISDCALFSKCHCEVVMFTDDVRKLSPQLPLATKQTTPSSKVFCTPSELQATAAEVIDRKEREPGYPCYR